MPDQDQNALVAQILSSYLANNTVDAADLAGVIASVKSAFGENSTSGAPSSSSEIAKIWEPAVPVKKSITQEALTCLCCGKEFKSIKRHLDTSHQLDPAQYRAAFNLKADYPLVAPVYAARRSDLAKSLGLGRKPKAEAPPPKKTSAKVRPAKKAAAAA